jgi:hypothetical protein
MELRKAQCAVLFSALSFYASNGIAGLVIYDNRDGAFVWKTFFNYGSDVVLGNYLDIRVAAALQTGEINDKSLITRYSGNITSDEPGLRDIHGGSASFVSRATTDTSYDWNGQTFVLRGIRQYAVDESVGVYDDWQYAALTYLHLPWTDSFDGGTPLIDSLAFVGVRIAESDGLHYGWVLLGNYRQPLMWAYETTPYVPAIIPTPSSTFVLSALLFAASKRRRTTWTK